MPNLYRLLGANFEQRRATKSKHKSSVSRESVKRHVIAPLAGDLTANDDSVRPGRRSTTHEY